MEETTQVIKRINKRVEEKSITKLSILSSILVHHRISFIFDQYSQRDDMIQVQIKPENDESSSFRYVQKNKYIEFLKN